MTDVTKTVSNNGIGSDTSNDWRREVLAEHIWSGMRMESVGTHPLIAAILRHLPDHSVRTFSEDRLTTLQSLQDILANWEVIVEPAIRHDATEPPPNTLPSFGWWRGQFAGPIQAPSKIEVILAPGITGGNRGYFIVTGTDAGVTNALVEMVLNGVHLRRSRFQRFAGVWKDAPDMQPEVEKLGWDDIVLLRETLDDIRRSVDLFFAQRDVFASLGFPWRRGLLFVGPPGTGKTMLCKAIAAAYPEIPFLYVEDVGRIRPGKVEIGEIFRRARRSAPCILAFEDIEGMVNDQNRSVFLNELDGFQNNNGLLIIASSNHPERIDEALLKRPSRFDRVYHIGLPATAERAAYCHRFLTRLPQVASTLDIATLSSRITEMTEGFTPAFLKEAFLSAALQMAQEGQTTLDEAFGAAVLDQVEILRQYLRTAKDPACLAAPVGAPGGEIGFRKRTAA